MKTENKNDILLIEDYIDGKLSKTETQEFEKRVKNDQEFEELYRFRLKIWKDLLNAKKYKTTQSEVANAVHCTKIKRKRNLIFAVAASLALMLMIAGALTLDFGGEEQQMAVSEIDTPENKTYQPQIKQPKRYADSGEYAPGVFFLEHKITTDSITFNWQPEIEAETEIIVISIENGEEVFKRTIKPGVNKITVYKSHPLKDNLVWYLKGTKGKDTILFH